MTSCDGYIIALCCLFIVLINRPQPVTTRLNKGNPFISIVQTLHTHSAVKLTLNLFHPTTLSSIHMLNSFFLWSLV